MSFEVRRAASKGIIILSWSIGWYFFRSVVLIFIYIIHTNGHNCVPTSGPFNPMIDKVLGVVTLPTFVKG